MVFLKLQHGSPKLEYGSLDLEHGCLRLERLDQNLLCSATQSGDFAASAMFASAVSKDATVAKQDASLKKKKVRKVVKKEPCRHLCQTISGSNQHCIVVRCKHCKRMLYKNVFGALEPKMAEAVDVLLKHKNIEKRIKCMAEFFQRCQLTEPNNVAIGLLRDKSVEMVHQARQESTLFMKALRKYIQKQNEVGDAHLMNITEIQRRLTQS